MAARRPGESLPSVEELIAVGAIRKAHGVRGEASTEPLTDSVERFTQLDEVFLVSPDRSQIMRAHVVSVREHHGRALVRFEEIGSPEELRAYQNWTVEVTPDNARQLEEGEYFIHDLIGLHVVERDRELGVVIEALEGSGPLMLVVQKIDGKTFDLPFVEAFCEEIDIKAKRLAVSLPAGLVDLEAVEELAEGPDADIRVEAKKQAAPSLTIDVATIFPSMFEPLRSEGVLARGIEQGIIELKTWDLRDSTTDRHRSTDDEAYGGGGGMVMLAEPLYRCVEAIQALRHDQRPHVILMSPQGSTFTQEKARELAARKHLLFVCGRYEGFDERIMALVDEELSIGDFVVTGGELPAMLIIDAVSRMIDGVVGTRNSVEKDSFYNGLLDYPHYTRPAELRGVRVPDVLLSGHTERIRLWRLEQSLRHTLVKRPDLLEKVVLDGEGAKILERLRKEVAAEASKPETKG